MTRDEFNRLRIGDQVMLRGGVGKRNEGIICEVTGKTFGRVKAKCLTRMAQLNGYLQDEITQKYRVVKMYKKKED